MRIIRSLILLLALASLEPSLQAQASPDCQANFGPTSSTGRIATFDNRIRGCHTWIIVANSAGYSAVSIRVDNAPNSTSGTAGSWTVWSSGSVVSGSLPLTSTTSSSATMTGYFPWVSVNITSATGTGTISGSLYGWKLKGDSVTIGGTALTDIGRAADAAEAIQTAAESQEDVPVNAKAIATGGTSGCAVLSTASTNATSCATAAAGFYGYELLNTTTTVYYLRLYNLATSPTCSSATGFVRSIPIPPASTSGLVGGAIAMRTIPNTASFTTGLAYCITGGSTSTDNTNAAAGIFGAIEFKQ